MAAGVGWRFWTTGGDGPGDPGGEPARPSPDAATEALGGRYIELVPEEATADALRVVLPPSLVAVAPGEQVELVAETVRRDFEEGSTIEVDGWLLSLTECRLAAMAVVS